MSIEREKFEAWCIKESISKSTHDLYLVQRIWQSATASMQAKLDALMLEFCPDEMTDEQMENWARHQRPVSDDMQAKLDA